MIVKQETEQIEIIHIKLTNVKEEICYVNVELEIKTIDNVFFYSIYGMSDNNEKYELMLVRPNQIEYMYKKTMEMHFNDFNIYDTEVEE